MRGSQAACAVVGVLFVSPFPKLSSATSIVERRCSPDTFTFPKLFGAEHRQITAAPLINYKGYSNWKPEAIEIGPDGTYVCNVTVSYSHPGYDDVVNVQVWLPLTNYNGRFVGVGGGGWMTGEFGDDIMSALTSKGFAAATTDGGHEPSVFFPADRWMLKSPGNVDYPMLLNFAHRASHDMAVIGKSVTEQFFGSPPKFSYWHGCSTGGRQGLAVAQRYPEDFDGILTSCPVVNFAALIMAMYWPQLVMDRLGTVYYPPACQFEAIVAAAVDACDELDGRRDGVIAMVDACHFDPDSAVGEKINCGGKASKITKETARIVKAVLQGPVDPEGEQLFPGAVPGTALTGLMALGNTICEGRGKCTGGRPFTLATDWIRFLLKKDPSFDVSSITHQEYADLFRYSVREFGGIIGSDDVNLRQFRKGGKKMITWHAIHDEAVTVKSTREYYERVNAYDSARGIDTTSYFRYFEVPGATHCSAPSGGRYPLHALDALRRWVEEGVAPETLGAVTLGNPQAGNDATEGADGRPICKYPQVPLWTKNGYACQVPPQEQITSMHQKDEL